jgi:hypothetical protein
VVPAFEYRPTLRCPLEEGGLSACGIREPQDKPSLIQLIKQEKVVVFHRHFAGSHRPTRTDAWQTIERPYYIQWANFYEPYLIVRRGVEEENVEQLDGPLHHRHGLGHGHGLGDGPRFDERFVDRGRNKIILATTLHLRGYRFVVLDEPAVLHHWEGRRTRKNKNMNYVGFLKNYGHMYRLAMHAEKILTRCWRWRFSCAEDGTFRSMYNVSGELTTDSSKSSGTSTAEGEVEAEVEADADRGDRGDSEDLLGDVQEGGEPLLSTSDTDDDVGGETAALRLNDPSDVDVCPEFNIENDEDGGTMAVRGNRRPTAMTFPSHELDAS